MSFSENIVSMPVRILGNLFLILISFWLAALGSKAPLELAVMTIVFAGLFLLLQFIAALDNLLASCLIVVVAILLLSLSSMDFLTARLPPSTAKGKAILNWILLLMLASNVVALAGWFPPFNFVWPLLRVSSLNGAIHLRFLATCFGLLVFLAAAFRQGYYSVRNTPRIWSAIKQEVFNFEPLINDSSVRELHLDKVLSFILPFVHFCFQSVFQLGRGIIYVSSETMRIIWECLTSGALWLTTLQVVGVLMAFLFIGQSCFAFAPELIAYVQHQGPWEEELTMLLGLGKWGLLAVLGVYCFALVVNPNTRGVFSAENAGRAGILTLAACVCGWVFFGLKASMLFPHMVGFEHVGCFGILVLSGAVTGATLVGAWMRFRRKGGNES